MFTQCTACRVWFKVSREQLHAVHGLVRCSACDTVFNALATLRHDLPAARTEPDASPRPIPTDTRSANPAGAENGLPATKPSPPPAAAGQGAGERAHTREGETNVPFPPPVRRAAPEVDTDTDTNIDTHTGTDEFHPEPGATPRQGERSEPAARADENFLQKPRGSSLLRRLGRHRVWSITLALALLVLAGQLVYAARVPLGALFGLASGPGLTLEDYTITGATLDAVPGRPGTLRLSGAMRNDAAHAQPLPLLRVTLTDRYGEALGARVLDPQQYGAGTQTALNAHRRFMFHVEFADPGASAVGFTLVLCRHRDHALWCRES